MNFKPTKKNTYNTIPKRAVGNIFKRKLDIHYISTNKEDQYQYRPKAYYFIGRYDSTNPMSVGIKYHRDFYQAVDGEIAPSIQ